MNKRKPLPIPQVIESSSIYDGFFKIQRDMLRLNECRYPYYTLIAKGPAVAILALTRNKQMILIEEYRHPIGSVLLGCPGGYVDDGEDPLTAARRELLEETGYTASHFFLLGTAFPYPGISGQKIYYICAQDAEKMAEPAPEPTESIATITFTEEQLQHWIASGQNIDGNLCTALFFYQASQRQGQRHERH